MLNRTQQARASKPPSKPSRSVSIRSSYTSHGPRSQSTLYEDERVKFQSLRRISSFVQRARPRRYSVLSTRSISAVTAQSSSLT